jgi:UDP-N-acetylmuramate dehydrogenase
MDLSFFKKELDINVIPGANLKDYTTFQLGGPCKALIECISARQMTVVATALHAMKIPFIVMGFGSNILASDTGVDTVIIRYSSTAPRITRNGNMVTVDAATQFDDLISWAVNENLDGLTAMSGIPGTVGGAIAGNAGAYGQQITDRLVRLTLLGPDEKISDISKDEIHFSYRDSDIKHNGHIVLYATFELEPSDDDKALLLKERAEKLSVRLKKHGDWKTTPCAGSFFKNVMPSSNAGQRQAAGWFLDEAGAKGMHVGLAHPYKEHANIVTRDNGATAQDVYDLTLNMAHAVKEKFGFELIREVRLLGKFNNAPTCDPQGFW